MKHIRIERKKNIRIIIIFGLIVGLLILFQQNSFGANNSDSNKDLFQCIMQKENILCAERALDSGATPDAQNSDKATLLMFAIVKYCDIGVINLLIDKSQHLNLQGNKGVTALMLASEYGYTNIVIKLLEKEADPNKTMDDGTTALILASQNGYTRIVVELLKKGAKPNQARDDGATAFKLAMLNKRHEIVSELFKKIEDLGVDQYRLFYNLQIFANAYVKKDRKFKKLLAETKGHCSGLSKMWLYSKWASKNNIGMYTDKWFQDTTQAIATWDWTSDLDGKTQDFNAFLDLVTLFQNSKYHVLNIPQTNFRYLLIISRLPTGGSLLNKEYTIASTVTFNQLIDLLNRIIHDQKLFLIDSFEPQSHTVALYKNQNDYYYYDSDISEGEVITSSINEIAKKIFKTFSLKQEDFAALGFTSYDFSEELSSSAIYLHQTSVLTDLSPPLHASALLPAAFIGCLYSTSYFLDNNVFLKRNDLAPILLAAQEGHTTVVKKYLSKNVDPDLQDGQGQTALMLACYGGFLDIVELLLEKGADMDKASNEGITALMFACYSGFSNIVELLFEKGADINKVSNQGKTALEYALLNNYQDCVSILRT